MAEGGKVAILGVFVADTAYRAARLPRIGETIMGKSFALGPGGKGSNQAVAAARLGAETVFISRLGRDAFADLALATWAEAGVVPAVARSETATGAAFIYVDAATGDNAIIVSPGAAAEISAADIDAAAEAIRGADVFMTQLEQPLEAARRGLEIARAAGAATVLNPAPAAELDDGLIALCDWLTPNESEAAALTGLTVETPDEARAAAAALRARGARGAVVTLGAAGALLSWPGGEALVPAVDAGPVAETTGAGDAFNGGFATALARGADPVEAARYGCAVAGISVTRPGTADSMPTEEDVAALLR
ncbi:MAG: ribokinase [Pseudomonadota bacterium]